MEMTSRRNRFERHPFLTGVSVAAVILLTLLVLLEVALAVFAPQIKFVGQSASLFRANAFGEVRGHWPNAVGASWGAEVVTNGRGFRVARQPIEPLRATERRIALVGDSVTFGVGVEAEDTFAGRLARVIPILNVAVTGYSANDYRGLTMSLLVPERDLLQLDRVLFFVTLNDPSDEGTRAIRRHLERGQTIAGLAQKATQLFDYNRWLIRRSRLYLLLKGVLYDGSRQHFEVDRRRFDDPTTAQNVADLLAEIHEALSEAGIATSFYMLPYEYQLRSRSSEDLLPQQELRRAMQERGLSLIDLFPAFEREVEEKGVGSRELFLFNDHCHLSSRGHLLVSRAVGERLGFSAAELGRVTAEAAP